MTVLALYSNKGGVGKTAAAVNLSYLAAQSGVPTLICDLDPQSSTTYYFRVKPKIKPKARGFIRGNKQVRKSIKGTDYENLDILPADFTHRNLDITFTRLKRSKHRLTRILKPLEDEYDLIILDCLPTINILAENIFNAADYVLVPITPTTLSIRNHRQLIGFLDNIGYDLNSVHPFLSMVDYKRRTHREFMEEIRLEFKGVLKSVIPYLSLVERMDIERQPVSAFAPISAASNAYHNLWGDIQRDVILTAKKGV